MSIKQTVFTTGVILAIVGLLVVVIVGSKNKNTKSTFVQNNQENSQAIQPTVNNGVSIFFYGNTCPHCADVEEWIEENKIEEKIEIVKKEVYDNRANSLELTKTAEDCGLPTDSIGVPFLYTLEGKCLIGTPDIVGYLSDKAGLPNNSNATIPEKENGQ